MALLIVKYIYFYSYILSGDQLKIHSATISSKGQITLPKRYRDDLHLIEGEEVLILRTDEGILIKHKKSPLRGILAGKIDATGFQKDLDELRKEWVI
jgi:AbrB family looped-hinge helix DNA binding protein